MRWSRSKIGGITRTIAVAVLLSVSICLTHFGCGGGKEDPLEAFQAAASALAETPTVHAQVEGEVSPEEDDKKSSYPFQGDLWLDTAARAMEARMTVLGMELMARYVGGEAYFQWGGKWFYLSQEGKGLFDLDNFRMAMEVLFKLPGLLSAAEAVPAGEGRAGQHGVLYLDLNFDYRTLAEREDLRGIAEAVGRDPSEISSWLEEADPVIRIGVGKVDKVLREMDLEMEVKLEGPVKLGGMITLPPSMRLRMHVLFPEFGMEVKVAPPTQAEPFRGF
ncbi:MAG: hypothetical protein WHT46_05450 [Candidatus Geothermincolales bacterium]